MRKLILSCAVAISMVACKNEVDKPAIVGTTETGEELIVNETGDTVVYAPPANGVAKISEENEETEETEELAIKESSDGTYNFVFNLEKGKVYPFRIVTTAKNAQSDGKESMTLNQESTTELEYAVAEVTPTGYLLNVTFKRFAEKMSDGKESIGFDTKSAEPSDEAAKQRYKFNKAIVGKTFDMTIDKNGNVEDVSNLFKVREKVKNELKTGMEAAQVEILDKFLAGALSDEAMQRMFEESVSYYPKEPVKKGATWSQKNGTETAKSVVTYTFDGVNEGIATIKISGTSKGSDSQTDPNGSGMKMSRSLNGTVNGTVNVNAKSGWIANATMKKNEEIRMTQELKGQKANFSSETNTTTKIN